ncbi:MAG TPA: ribosome maturation factor RimM [Gemmatimonadaceae bacterium]|nr:ribosome maturation factor RimM [Gemmatimonadaceae bacterium]
MAADALAIVGLIRNAQGIRGEVVIEPLTDAPDAVFASGRRVFVGDGGEQTFSVEKVRPFKGGLMVKFEGVNDRNAAELLRGRYVFSPFDELEPPGEDEVYLHELIGMRVELDTGEAMGEVSGYYELPQGLTLDVKTEKGSVLIPYRAEVVERTDSDARVVVVKSDVGLFD